MAPLNMAAPSDNDAEVFPNYDIEGVPFDMSPHQFSALPGHPLSLAGAAHLRYLVTPCGPFANHDVSNDSQMGFPGINHSLQGTSLQNYGDPCRSDDPDATTESVSFGDLSQNTNQNFDNDTYATGLNYPVDQRLGRENRFEVNMNHGSHFNDSTGYGGPDTQATTYIQDDAGFEGNTDHSNSFDTGAGYCQFDEQAPPVEFNTPNLQYLQFVRGLEGNSNDADILDLVYGYESAKQQSLPETHASAASMVASDAPTTSTSSTSNTMMSAIQSSKPKPKTPARSQSTSAACRAALTFTARVSKIQHGAVKDARFAGLSSDEILHSDKLGPNDLCGEVMLTVAETNENAQILERLNELRSQNNMSILTPQIIPKRIRSALEAKFGRENFETARSDFDAVRERNGVRVFGKNQKDIAKITSKRKRSVANNKAHRANKDQKTNDQNETAERDHDTFLNDMRSKRTASMAELDETEASPAAQRARKIIRARKRRGDEDETITNFAESVETVTMNSNTMVEWID